MPSARKYINTIMKNGMLVKARKSRLKLKIKRCFLFKRWRKSVLFFYNNYLFWICSWWLTWWIFRGSCLNKNPYISIYFPNFCRDALLSRMDSKWMGICKKDICKIQNLIICNSSEVYRIFKKKTPLYINFAD